MGALIGFGVYALILMAAENTLRTEIGVTLNLTEPHVVMAIVPLSLITLGALVGIVPAAKAYNTDVAKNLIPQS